MYGTAFILFCMLFFSNPGLSQGLYLPAKKNGSMIDFSYGESKFGKRNIIRVGYSHKGQLSGTLAFQQAGYTPSGVDLSFFSGGVYFHFLKAVKEGDWVFDLSAMYSYGDFTKPEFDTGDWKTFGKEIEVGFRLGSRWIDAEEFVIIPHVDAKYFWQELKFVDKRYQYTRSEDYTGGRLAISLDMLFSMEKEDHILLSPYFHFETGVFIWGGKIGFLWGALH